MLCACFVFFINKSFPVLFPLQKTMTLKPQQCTDNEAGPLIKRKPTRVPNGLSLEPCKNNHHHQQPSDQENNPRLAHKHGKRKKKHLKLLLVMENSSLRQSPSLKWKRNVW